MLIQDLPQGVRAIAVRRSGKGYLSGTCRLDDAFIWCKSPEGHDFWGKVDKEDYLDFYKMYPVIPPKRGDWVEVRKDNYSPWRRRIFLTEIEGANYPFITVCEVNEKKFLDGDKFSTVNWQEMRVCSIVEVTIEEIAKWKGVNPSEIHIKR